MEVHVRSKLMNIHEKIIKQYQRMAVRKKELGEDGGGIVTRDYS